MIWLILILGLILRLVFLNQSFWLDEATSASVVRYLGFKEIITRFAPGDFHPPLYYLILKAWTQIFGLNEVSARTLSILAGLGTISLVYLIGREIFNKKVGIFGAILLSTSPLHIYYSQEARMYALATFFVALAVFSFVKTIREGRVGYWFLFGLSITLAIATDYVPLLILPVFWLFGIISKQNHSWWKKFFASHIILLVIGLFWLPFFLQQFSGGIGIITTSPSWWKILGLTSIKNLALVPVKFILGRISFDNKLLYGFIVSIVLLLFGYLLFRSIRLIRSIKNLSLVWFWFFLPISLAALIGLKISIFSYFRLLFCLPAFYLLVATVLTGLKSKFVKPLILILLAINLAASFYYLFNPKFHREDWRGLVEALGTRHEVVVVFPAKSQREAFLYYNKNVKIVEPENLNKNHKEIWLIRYITEITDPKDLVRQKVESLGYNKASEENFNGVVAWKYKK